MIRIQVPGDKIYEIQSVILDYNGTVAKDGALLEGVPERLLALHEKGVTLYVITADTHGTVAASCATLPVQVHIVSSTYALADKRRLVNALKKEHCASIGNGRNDAWMLEDSAIGICVIGDEGAHQKSIAASDIVVTNIVDALDLLLIPSRLIATLRG